MKRLAAMVLAIGLISGPGWTQQQPPTLKLTPALNTVQAQELLQDFQLFCLDKYPDENAVAQALEKVGAAPMAAEPVRDILGGPGKGWMFEGKNGPFIVTLKAAPDLHCAVRAAAQKPFAPDWGAFVRKTAATRKQELSDDIHYDQRNAGGGVPHVFVNIIPGPARLESYTLIVEEHPERKAHRMETRVMRRIMAAPRQR